MGGKPCGFGPTEGCQATASFRNLKMGGFVSSIFSSSDHADFGIAYPDWCNSCTVFGARVRAIWKRKVVEFITRDMTGAQAFLMQPFLLLYVKISLIFLPCNLHHGLQLSCYHHEVLITLLPVDNAQRLVRSFSHFMLLMRLLMLHQVPNSNLI